jgi:hypothetical protein
MGKIETRQFAHFSVYHLIAGIEFALRSRGLEYDGNPANEGVNRSHVLAAVVSAVGFLEATINEFFLLAADDSAQLFGYTRSDIAALKAVWDENTERLNILQKYQLALAVCMRPAFDKGVNPYQDAATVVTLRNTIVHYKEGWRLFGQELAIERQLKGKFRENPLTSQNMGRSLLSYALPVIWLRKMVHSVGTRAGG